MNPYKIMKKGHVNISALTKTELDNIQAMANFNKEQNEIFLQLNYDNFYDYAIYNNMGISSRRYYSEKKIVIDKCDRLAQELGYTFAIKSQ